MAVQPERIKARVKAKYPNANLSTTRIDALAAKLSTMPADDATDEAIDLILDQANTFNSFEDIAREDDRIRTLEKKAAEKPGQPEPPKPPAADPDETPAYMKAVLSKLDAVTTELETIKTGKVTETKRQQAEALFAKSESLKSMKPELRERWLNRVNLSDAEKTIEAQVIELETEYSDLVQSNADNSFYPGAAGGGSALEKANEKVVNDVLSNVKI